jgi:ABC-type Fe3+ transport system permease subunit
MLLEEEVPRLLRAGLLIVMLPVFGMLISFCVKYKRNGFGWILSHFVLFTMCAIYFTRILETRAFTSSAYNSLAFALIGIVWAISMTLLVMGILEISKRSRSKSD